MIRLLSERGRVSRITRVVLLAALVLVAQVAVAHASLTIVGGVTEHNYGKVRLGSGPHDFVVTLKSGGNTSGISCAITAGDSLDFDVTGCPTADMGNGEEVPITVSFDPTDTVGAKSATLTISWSSDEATIALSGSVPALWILPTSHSFSDTLVNGTDGPFVFDVYNDDPNSSHTVGISDLGVACADEFTFDTTMLTSPLGPAGPGDADHTTFTVTFKPESVGSHSCSYTATSDLSAVPTTTINVDGHGIAGDIDVAPPGPYDFNSHDEGTTTDLGVTITNAGNADLKIIGIALDTTPGCDHFGLTDLPAPDTSLVPAAQANFTVQFIPLDWGDFTCDVLITSDDPDTHVYRLGVLGTGLAGDISFNPASPHTFSDLDLGSTESQDITINNVGNAALDVTGISKPAGTECDQFNITTDPTPVNIVALGQATLTVQFAPTVYGLSECTLTVTSSDPGGPATYLLRGTGRAPDISLSETTYTFPDHIIGVTTPANTRDVTINNVGSGPLDLISITESGTGCGNFSLTDDPSPTSINAGALDTFTVQFLPTVSGNHSCDYTITSNDPDEPTVTWTASGHALDPAAMTVTPGTAMNLGSVLVGSSGNDTFTISNATGTHRANLVGTVSRSGTNPGQFTVAPTSFNISPGSSVTVTVTFSPTSMGVKNAQIDVNNTTDPSNPSDSFAVSGTGIDRIITLTEPSGGINFGNVLVGTSSAGETITIQNDGNSDLTISAVEIIGTNPLDFQITAGQVSQPGNAGDDFTVAGAATESWTVSCLPTAVGNRNGTFRITSNGTNQTSTTVALSCHGTEPELVITPSPISFPGTFVCDDADVITVTLRNNGTAPLTIGSLTSSSSAFTVSSSPADPNLAPTESTTFDVTFEPAAVTTYNETLTVAWSPSGPSTVVLTGAGLSKNLVPAPASYDFTGVNTCESAVSHTFTITNNGTGPFRVMSVAVDNVADFSVVEIDSLPTAALGSGESMAFQVDAMPQALGSASGTITVTTDIPSLCGSTAQIPISATGVSPGADFAPVDLDFGGGDVQAGPVTRSITVTNSGGEELQVSDVVLDGDAEFSLADGQETAFTVAPGGSADIEVEYRSTNVSENAATLTITSNADCGDETVIDLLGHGIDREIDLSTYSLDFPETYRNTATPSTQSFTISNLGEADLNVSMVETSGAGRAAFAFAEAVPSVVAGGATATVTVEFTPTAAGEFLAEITLGTDDSDEGVAHISLEGIGRVPNIDAPVDIDLGRVGVGVPVRVSDLVAGGIEFSNMESDAFTVANLLIADVRRDGVAADSSLFTVLGVDDGTTLGAGQSLSVDVEFTPDVAGSYEAALEIYLDQDPEEVTFVTIRAQAVQVRVRGGGGCSVGASGSGTGGALLVVLLVGFVVSRRRRGRGRARALVALLAAGGALAVVAPARADTTRNLDLSVFRPMPGADPELLSLESPRVGLPGSWSLGVFFDYAMNPLTLESSDVDGTDSIVSARSEAAIAFSYTIKDKYEAGLLVPMMSQSGDASTVIAGVEPASGASLGDLALHGKASLLRSGSFALAGSATITLPTASDGQFAGVDGPTVHARGIAGFRRGPVLVAANAGVRLRGKGQFGDAEQGHELTYGLATSYRIARKLQGIGELYGSSALSGSGGPAVRPVELALGVRYRATRELGVVVGGGGGLSSGIGAAAVRAFVLLSYTMNARELPQIVVSPGVSTHEVDLGDNDEDGVPNQDDRCPDQAEDLDDFEDEDGCPDPDNDKDGLPDADDPCPNKAEDKDGYKDADGCPDEDNDGDGIPDKDDKCPDEPEDKDGFQDRDGCDDPDNDKDGIPDVIDQCALEAETINGKKDDDGCPDPGDSLVMVMPDRIEVFEPVRFDGNSARISRKSRNVLGQVAATLRANRDFLKIRIGVHVQPRNANDEKLTKLRAEAVRKWLIDWGVEPERLEVKGYGSARPLVPKNSKNAKKVNDRVEFVIIEKRVRK